MSPFTLSGNLKKLTYVLMAVGLATLVYGLVADDSPHHQRVWANLLVNSFFFFAIALGATFFVAMQYAAEAAWAVALKRVFEAVMAFLPVGAGLMLFIFLMGSLHVHHLYHWMDPDVTNPDSADYDAIIAGKTAYLNQPFFWARAIVFIGVYVWVAHILRRRSLQEDAEGGTRLHFKNVTTSAAFLVFFGFTSMVAAWDWLMSIDTHWFSTIFGWYVFAGMWIGAIMTALLLTHYLRRKGHLGEVNESHFHDLGKWLFALSFLWTYLWFAQFMLIWYANLPEEVTYYQQRIGDYRFIFFFTMVVNFALPMALLMSRDAKRRMGTVIPIAAILFVTHWLDVMVMVMPGAMGKTEWSFGLIETGMFLGFLGVFMLVVFTALGKRPLMVKHHPYLEESLHHEI